jgi:hypothetical protein
MWASQWKGTYHFRARYASTKYYSISNNDSGVKAIIFPLLGFDRLTIDGGGSDFLFHGEVLPFVVDGCGTSLSETSPWVTRSR